MNIDWPLAIALAVVFVVMSYVRWRWFTARARRIPPRHAPPKPPPNDQASI